MEKNKKGGGMVVCIKDSLLYKCREDLDKSNVDTESVFIELDKGTLNFNRDVIIGVLYRPPYKDITVFTAVLHAILKTIQKGNYVI